MNSKRNVKATSAQDLKLRWKRFKRSQKKLRIFRRAEIVLVAYAKSGRTWLSVMITHLAHQRFGTPLDELVASSEFRRRRRDVPQFFLTADNFAPPGMSAESRLALYKQRKVILLVRDPRDVAVSLYFQLSKRASPLERAIFEAPDNLDEIGLFNFMCDPRMGLPRIIAWLNRWEDWIGEIPESLMLNYEQLRSDTPRGLSAVSRLIGWDCSEAEIQAAADFADFNKLKDLERQHFFRSARMQPGNPGDTNSYKVRRGKIGGYRDYFSPKEVAEIDAILSEQLSHTLGYSAEPVPNTKS